jgi:hypothetical protein
MSETGRYSHRILLGDAALNKLCRQLLGELVERD